MYSYWLLCIKLKYSEYSLSYILQYEVYWGPSKEKVITVSVITATPIAVIFTRLLSILNALSIYVNDSKFVGKNVHRGCTYEQIL